MSRSVAVAVAPPETLAASPRRRGLRPRVAAAAIVAAALAAGLWFAIGLLTSSDETTRFEVWDHGRQAVIYAREVEVGGTFVLEHTHSVTRRVVVETFSVQDASTIAIEELWFDEFGANLPAGPERIGDTTTTFVEEDGAYRVLHHGHPIGSLPLMVGSPDVDHVVTFEDGERLRLLDVTRPGARVEFTVGGGPR